MADYHFTDPPNRDWLIEVELFGPSLKHICLTLCDDFYDVDSWDGPEHARKRVVETLEGDLSFEVWPTIDQKTSLTLHDARPEAFPVGLADTVIYEMPRRTDAGVDEWKEQIMMIKGDMGCYMSELGYELRQGEAGADSWKPHRRRDIPQLFLSESSYSQDGPYEQFDQAFRKWWKEVVSFEGPTKCECCDIFKKGHPKVRIPTRQLARDTDQA
ncbi:hypothetical protein I350_08272 [Cryptococcus amylolentus CBS 6273]|uniref:Uncharacterized protein n=1 Tax=Cryptococcus amylolentus CBS 6273 TaxID=1296118 RepID=A0A1E3J6H1_9TREE|nr:hypothetical protein I350_08272 [Cryptococcus amylolentus CBS 6273]